MGCVQKSLEKYQDALKTLKRVHSGRKQELGEDDPETLDTAFEIGDIHLIEKRFGEAVKILVDVYRARSSRRVLISHVSSEGA